MSFRTMSLNQSGIDYICQNFGDASLCCVRTGLQWRWTDIDGATGDETGGTAQVVSRLINTMLITKVTMLTPARGDFTYSQLRTANGGADVNLNDCDTILQHDSPPNQWCYTAQNYTLTITVTPSGSGSVAKNPDQATYPSGTIVVLTATPSSGYSFSHWGGDLTGTTNPKSITMNGNKTVTATFNTGGGGTDWMKYLLYAGIGLAVVGIIIYAVRRKPPAYNPPPKRR
jgi:uncharacterized repeat protein (TIGR02543 family)